MDKMNPIDALQQARDYLASHWTKGLGEPDRQDGATCAIGSLARVLAINANQQIPVGTDWAIELIRELDGEALDALINALPDDFMSKYQGHNEGLVWKYNDEQRTVGPVLDLFDRAIAKLS